MTGVPVPRLVVERVKGGGARPAMVHVRRVLGRTVLDSLWCTSDEWDLLVATIRERAAVR